jgi:hypothetical protein
VRGFEKLTPILLPKGKGTLDTSYVMSHNAGDSIKAMQYKH